MPHVSYFWDEIEDNVVEEFDGDTGATIASYTTEPSLYGSVLSQARSDEKRCFHFDGQGNTTELTDQSGAVTDMHRYSAFGETKAGNGATSTPLGFGGRWGYHAIVSQSLTTIRRRILNLATGRWAAPDAHEHVDPSESTYVYSANRPVEYVDPSGLTCQSCDISGMNVEQEQLVSRPGFASGWIGMQHNITLQFSGICMCCEFRQEISGYGAFRTYPGGQWNIKRKLGQVDKDGHAESYVEDRAAPPSTKRAGHRSEDSGYFTWPFGCNYSFTDLPGLRNVSGLVELVRNHLVTGIIYEINWNLRLSAINTCLLPNPQLFEKSLRVVFCVTILPSAKSPEPQVVFNMGRCPGKVRGGLDDAVLGHGQTD